VGHDPRRGKHQMQPCPGFCPYYLLAGGHFGADSQANLAWLRKTHNFVIIGAASSSSTSLVDNAATGTSRIVA
jgi:hypothetical protein